MERKSEILQNTIIKNGLLQCWENGEETVCVPEGVTTIGKCCFRGMTSIKKVIFPESLRTIGEYSFDGCSNLETLVFSSGLKRIGNACFRNCVSLESIILPDSLVSMHAEAFENCLRLSGLSLPDSLKNNIESHTFSGCLSLRSINLPAGVRQVKNRYNEIYRLQMPNITPHVCRHTYCSNQARAGMNPKTLQYLMGCCVPVARV